MRISFKLSTAFIYLAYCLNALSGEIQVTVNDTAGKPIENAVVYAESPTTKTASTSTGTANIAQKNKKFTPLVSVVQTGSNVSFPNQDSVRHHVYSFSPAKTFELKLYSGVPTAPIVFDKPGVVVLGCNIHDTMVAFVNVVDTPYFGKTDAAGKVSLKDIPNGQYTLKTWHYALVKENVVAEQAINIKGNEQVTVTININPEAIINR
ncbi:MAG TPA: methylamine utilization protein [Methylophilaceae bacterium]|jgi:plastocyanin